MDKLDWNQLKAFLKTAETGSLSAAARQLGLSQPTLSRQVAALEQRLGVTLFERVGKAMAPTASGLDLLEHVRAMGTAADTVRLAASGHSQAVAGVVTVSATDTVAAHLLPPLLRQLREQAPGIQVEVVSFDGVSDLLRREADIAIRHLKPEQPDLIARHIREAEAHFYATADWVKQHGHPRTAEDAVHLPFVGHTRGGPYLSMLRHHGLPVTEANFSCYASQTATHWALVTQGLGIGAMMKEIAATTPNMVQVLDDVPPIRFPIWLVTHRELRTSKRIQVVFEALGKGLG